MSFPAVIRTPSTPQGCELSKHCCSLSLSLRGGCHTVKLKAREECSLRHSLDMFDVTGMWMGYIKPCSPTQMSATWHGRAQQWKCGNERNRRLKGGGEINTIVFRLVENMLSINCANDAGNVCGLYKLINL